MQPFLLSKHLSSLYRDDRIQPFKLSTLTPTNLHNDDRWKTRDLPSLIENGLYYPLLIYKTDLYWWNTKYKKLYSNLKRHATPVINDDGMIHAIKIGNNRYECAVHLGYETIDAIMLDSEKACIQLGIWFRDCDPLNKDAPAYTGAFGY